MTTVATRPGRRTPLWARFLAGLSRTVTMRSAVTRPGATLDPLDLPRLVRLAQRGLPEAEYRVGLCYLHGDGVPASPGEARHWLTTSATHGHPEAARTMAQLCLDGWGGAAGQGAAGPFGVEHRGTPSMVEALLWAERAAGAGSAEGEALLAGLLASGPVAGRDPERAAQLFARSAAAGCPRGMLGHAVALSQRHEVAAQRAALGWLHRASTAGLAEATYLLGVAAEHGLGQAPDRPRAMGFYRKAAERGHVPAQSRWALSLMRGEGSSPDLHGAETWLRTAARHGDPTAAFHLGELCARPDGRLPARYAEAAVWFGQAAAAGHRDAARALGQLHLTGAGVPRDPAQAETWFKRAAAAGDLQAEAELGNLMLDGFCDAEARRHTCAQFAAAAEAGDRLAAYNYGVCLAEGIGTVRDDARAAAWLAKACAGVAEARLWYGRFLCEGRGVAVDLEEGRRWIARAAQDGVPEAQALLASLPDAPAPRQHRLRAPATASFGTVQRAEARPPGAAHRARPPSCACGSGLAADQCCAWVAGEGNPDADGIAALRQRAVACAESGDVAAARTLCLSILSRTPGDSVALVVLAAAYRRDGNDGTAEVLLRRALAVDPNTLQATLDLATLSFERGALLDAERLARNAVRLAPAHHRAHMILGMVLTESQRPHLGEVHYRRALALAGERDPIAVANLAWNLKSQSRIAEARALYQEAAAAAPHVFTTWLGWAQLEEADGRLPAAWETYAVVRTLRPDDPDTISLHARLLAGSGHAQEAVAALQGGALDDNPDLVLQRGRLLEGLGRYAEAFHCFARGKALAGSASGNAYLAETAAMAARHASAFFVRDRLALLPPGPPPADGPQPIFILGFPRSGTTLCEQALSAHPLIRAGDELTFVNDLVDEVPSLLGSPLPYPEALAELWMADGRLGLEVLRDRYLRRAALRGLRAPDKAYFTDKMPLNEMHMGLIALMFPQAPLVHLIRHPLDVVVSVFAHHLTHGYFCAFDLRSIARHYVLVMDLVDRYRAEMPLRYHPVRYEALVTDLPAQMRGMLDAIGVAFDEACLRADRNERHPQTPSCTQVREPVHTRAIGRYRHYRTHLAEAADILGPVMDRLGYRFD